MPPSPGPQEGAPETTSHQSSQRPEGGERGDRERGGPTHANPAPAPPRVPCAPPRRYGTSGTTAHRRAGEGQQQETESPSPL
jgi:hypothetical protein